jgi:hypothetical protein
LGCRVAIECHFPSYTTGDLRLMGHGIPPAESYGRGSTGHLEVCGATARVEIENAGVSTRALHLQMGETSNPRSPLIRDGWGCYGQDAVVAPTMRQWGPFEM